MHVPVLLREVLEIIDPTSGKRILDCTFGGGGHTKEMLDISNCYVCSMDRDPDAEQRANEIKETYKNRFDFVQGNFSSISNIFCNKEKFDAVLFDLGISSFQLDEADRGFSFSKDARLDMRMSKSGISAYEVVNNYNEEDLADIIWTYGEEKKSRKIASYIVNARQYNPIETTLQLSAIIHNAIGFSFDRKKYSKIDTATKTFQAIRIFVNDEFKELHTSLNSLPQILKNHSRIAIISFHALEDRIVKNWARVTDGIHIIYKTVIKPTLEEIQNNPRSRSAILRGFLYTEDREILRE